MKERERACRRESASSRRTLRPGMWRRTSAWWARGFPGHPRRSRRRVSGAKWFSSMACRASADRRSIPSSAPSADFSRTGRPRGNSPTELPTTFCATSARKEQCIWRAGAPGNPEHLRNLLPERLWGERNRVGRVDREDRIDRGAAVGRNCAVVAAPGEDDIRAPRNLPADRRRRQVRYRAAATPDVTERRDPARHGRLASLATGIGRPE